MSDLYEKGLHPYWCQFEDCDGDDPNHIGHTSRVYAQTGEAVFTTQLSRIDHDVPAGTRTGRVQVRLTLQDGCTANSASAEMTVDECRVLSLVLAQYVNYAVREEGGGHHTRELIEEERP